MTLDPPRNVDSRSKGFPKNLALCGSTILLLLIVAELGARAFYDPPNLGTVIHFDRNLGWSLEPNSKLRTVDHRGGLDYYIRINSLGMREREFSLEKKTGTKRMLYVGDSVTFGTGVGAHWRFSDFTGRALQDNVEVVNAGVPGWGNDQELIYFESIAENLRPDIVVLVLTVANDVVNNALDHLFLGSAPKPRFVLAQDSLILVNQVQRRNSRPQLKTILKQSRFLLFVKRRLDRLNPDRTDSNVAEHVLPGFHHPREGGYYSHWSVFKKTYEPELEDAWEVTGAIICRFSALCREMGADLIVFCFPSRIEVDGEWRHQMLERRSIDPAIFDFERPFERLSAYCAEQSIEFYYPIEEFKAAFPHQNLYFERDGHPNQYGHALAARVILGILEDKHHMEFKIAGSDLEYLRGP